MILQSTYSLSTRLKGPSIANLDFLFPTVWRLVDFQGPLLDLHGHGSWPVRKAALKGSLPIANGLRVCTTNKRRSLLISEFEFSHSSLVLEENHHKAKPPKPKYSECITASCVPCQNPIQMSFLSMAQLNSEGFFFIHSHLQILIEKLVL